MSAWERAARAEQRAEEAIARANASPPGWRRDMHERTAARSRDEAARARLAHFMPAPSFRWPWESRGCQ